MKKIKTLLAFVLLLPISTVWGNTFSDVPLENGLYTPIEYLKNIEVLKGYEDGSFGLSRAINRAEALKVILTAAENDVSTQSENDFGDVPRDAWFAPLYTTQREIILFREMEKRGSLLRPDK